MAPIGAPRARKHVAVSLTTLPLDADSRAFRIAGALAEAGYRSIVVEAQASSRRFWGEDIEVYSTGHAASGSTPNSALRPGRLRDTLTAIRRGGLGPLGEIGLYAGFRVFDWWRYRHCVRPLIPPAELYVLHSFELYRVVAPLARRYGARILYDAHDFYRGIEPQSRWSRFDRKWRQPFLRRLEDRLVSEANMVTTVSCGVADLMADEFRRKPEVIRNCHDERHDRTDARPLRALLKLGSADRLAVVVGNYKAGLAFEAAAAALQFLPETWHIAFLGRGYETPAAKLPPGLVGKRLHIGYTVAPDEVVPTIRSADLGLVLYQPYSENYRYALPNGFFQVIAAGLPLACGVLPEIEATIAGHMAGYSLKKLEPDALAQTMTRCVEDADWLRPNVSALAQKLRWQSEAMRLRRVLEAGHVPTRAAGLSESAAVSQVF